MAKIPMGPSNQSRQTWKRITATYILSPDGLLVLEGALREWDAILRSEVRTVGAQRLQELPCFNPALGISPG